MSLQGLLSENLKIVVGLKPDADRLAGTQTGDYVNMGLFQKFLGILDVGAGATGTTVVTVVAASDASGTGAEALPFKYRRVASGDTAGAVTAAAAAGFTTTAGGGDQYLIELDAAELPEDKPWLAVVCTEAVDSPVDAGLLYVLGNPRFAGANIPTAIA